MFATTHDYDNTVPDFLNTFPDVQTPIDSRHNGHYPGSYVSLPATIPTCARTNTDDI
jgi:hypothetical protein